MGMGDQPRPSGGGGPRRSAGAFMALPRDPQRRQEFTTQFLEGSWVRSFAFTSTPQRLYYCLQPGRIGVMYGNAKGSMSTVVVDIHNKSVLWVKEISNADDTILDVSHPHVATSFQDSISFHSMDEAQRVLGGILGGLQEYIDECRRARREGRPSPNVLATYVHPSVDNQVAPSTKWSYLRRAYPHPNGQLIMFRLSNRRSQILLPQEQTHEIRWMSDRSGTVGVRYYVKADGTAEPFTVDKSGVMDAVENMFMTSYAAPRKPLAQDGHEPPRRQ
jgi:hypothetical protein